MEFVGQARELRRRIAMDHAADELAIEEILRPIRPRDRFRPVPKHAVLRELEARWRALPSLSRLSAAGGFVDGKLKLGETRCAPSRMRFAAWSGSEPEPAIAIMMTAIFSQPPRFAQDRLLIADLGLHSLARRFQRGDGRDDDSVLRDLAALSHAYKDTIAAGGEFTIPAGGGRWIGTITTVKGVPAMAIRTFISP